MSSQRVLVTGGLGYIGSHTVVELIKAGFEVTIIDNLSNSRMEVLDRIDMITNIRPEFHKIDLRDASTLRSFFHNSEPYTGIVHFAALKSVEESMRKPMEYYENNVISMIHLLREAQAYAIPYLVFSSSCTVYGQPDILPVDETAPFKETASVYGETKQICEKILRSTSTNSGMRVISLRYFNPIGSHDSALIGEWPSKVPENLVPYLTQTAAGIRDYLKIYGNDYKTDDGTAIRDYIHVVDLAEAHVFALRYLYEQQDLPYEVFNLGTGTGYSVMDVINSFKKVSGKELPMKIVNRRPGDIESIYAEPKKAWNVLGWRAQRDLDDMMRSAWQWQLELIKNNNS